jgi:hypothetical protein
MSFNKTPSFRFSRRGKTVFASFNNHPLKDSEGKEQEFHFHKECASDLEAYMLRDFLFDMEYEMRKHYFTEGFNTHKKKEKNWFL